MRESKTRHASREAKVTRKPYEQRLDAVKKTRYILVFALLTSLALCGCAKREGGAGGKVDPLLQEEMASMIAELHQQAVEPAPDYPGEDSYTRLRLHEEHMERKLKRRAEIVERFVAIGRAAVPVLIEAMDDDTRYRYVGRTAAEAIGKIGDPDSIPILNNLVASGNSSQRQVAAEALGNLRSKTSVGVLERALTEDTNAGVRLKAAIALGEIGVKSAIESLAARVADKKENPSVRAYAVTSLGKLKASSKIHLILLVFEESHKQSPAGQLAIHCHGALCSITGERIRAYGTTHPAPGELDKSVQAWLTWWENVGKLKYPQS